MIANLPKSICLWLVASACVAARGEEVTLKGSKWSIHLDPATLSVSGSTQDNTSLSISSAATEALHVADLSHDDRHAYWTLPDQQAVISVALEQDVLIVDVSSDAVGSFTWPVIAANPRLDAFILPMFEGLCVPADDARWIEFLTKQGALDTTADLSMPFLGTVSGKHSLTFVLANPFNNQIEFQPDAGRLGLKLTHTFTANNTAKECHFRIYLGDDSPATPAKTYRQYLIDTGQFVSLSQKIAKTPDVAKLLGAAQVYLWGNDLIGRDDISDYKKLSQWLSTQTEPAAKRIWSLMTDDSWKMVGDLPAKEWVDDFDKRQVVDELTRILKLREFYDAPAWDKIMISDEAKKLIEAGIPSLSDVQVARLNCLLLDAAIPDLLKPVDAWGDGWSVKMIKALTDAGIDRLWLGSPDWDGLKYHPGAVKMAIAAGYLVGPYDSYDSIHSPTAMDTWETAQFDRELYETGAVVNADGSKRKGFQQKGYILSPRAARPSVEKRVAMLMSEFHCNSWFVDCDAFGQLFDDYSPQHPATQSEDAAERLSRMAWICDTYHAVIGSEGGSAYAAPVIDFAHGMMTPVIGWGDPDLMKDKSSKYYLGAYYPPEGPTVFFKQVPMKEEYRRVYADPHFRLPLYEIVFHDSVFATHEWSSGSLKFDDPDHARELLELLYNVPPLYHLNPAEWRKRANQIKRHYAFFSPLHRESGLLPMTDFAWLTPDRSVQRTMLGDQIELVANFGDAAFAYQGDAIPAQSILAALAAIRPEHLLQLPGLKNF